jgi:transcriptional regulator with XRE-family HTH domain
MSSAFSSSRSPDKQKKETARAPRASQNDFCRNLRLLCGFYRSIADVCRKLQINRAQFTRYLGGESKPSSHSLNRICAFFGVEPAEIYLPPNQFMNIIQARPRQRAERTVHEDHIALLQKQSEGRFEKYLGYYYAYYYSMGVPGKVLRGLVRLYPHEGAVYHERLERFPQHANLDDIHRYKYLGATFFLNDRIFLVDYESTTKNEIAHTILYPTCKAKVARLHGLILGLSFNAQRAIACARIVFEYLGQDIDRKKALRSCGLFDPGAGSFDPMILKAIDNSQQQDQHHFYTLPL